MVDRDPSPSPKEGPAVTICVTCYNQEAYIRQCLEGILAQDFEAPVEILIGDDSSTDRSVEIIEDCCRVNPRISLIRRPKNLGFVANQRDLFARARGEFVALCEADDFWIDPQKLRRQVAAMAAQPSATLSLTAGSKVSEDGKSRLGELRISRRSRVLELEEVIREVGNRLPTASILMRRSALEALPEEAYRQVIIDYSLKVLLGARGTVWYDAEPTCAYRVMSQGSWTSGLADSPAKYVRHHEGLRTYEKFLEGELGPKYSAELRRAFEPLVLGFYLSSRVPASDKIRNLPEDLPRLGRRGRILAALLTRVPIIALTGGFARRRIWKPITRVSANRP